MAQNRNSIFEFFKTSQKAQFAQTQMIFNAVSVIQSRLTQTMLGTMTAEEATRMVLEKQSTFAKSLEMSARALASNKGLSAAALAAIQPIEAKTKANARRLSRAK